MNEDLYTGAKVWFDCEAENLGAKLRIEFAADSPCFPPSKFFIPLSATDGVALGWLQFERIAILHQKPIFGAVAWRPATEPAPPELERLQLPLNPLLAGFSPTG